MFNIVTLQPPPPILRMNKLNEQRITQLHTNILRSFNFKHVFSGSYSPLLFHQLMKYLKYIFQSSHYYLINTVNMTFNKVKSSHFKAGKTTFLKF